MNLQDKTPQNWYAIRLGTEDDLERLIEFYDFMIDVTAGTDCDPRWLKGVHPSEKQLRQALRSHTLLLMETSNVRTKEDPNASIGSNSSSHPYTNGPELIGAVIFDHDVVQGYNQVAWAIDANKNEIRTLHLLAIHPHFQGKGLARAMVHEVCRRSQKEGVKAIRIDVLATNQGSVTAYERMGFLNHGHAQLAYEDPTVRDFIMMELVL